MKTPMSDLASPIPRSVSSERTFKAEATTIPERSLGAQNAFAPQELPLTVKAAALYLGVSIQTVYLWVERKQIPHLRVMGRNIRFLRSDLEPFRAQFRHEVANGKTA